MSSPASARAEKTDLAEQPAPLQWSKLTKLPIAIIAGMFLLGAALYSRLPATIPRHWGISGAPDAWSPKTPMSVFALPLLALGLYVLLIFVPRIDPKRRNLLKSVHAYNIVIDIVIGLEALVYVVTLVAAFTPKFDASRVIIAGVGVLLMVIGNYMASVRQNWTFGIRYPWTLSDEVVWKRTNRLGGYLFVGAGAATLVSALLPPVVSAVVVLSSTLSIVGVTVVYSLLLFRKRHPEA